MRLSHATTESRFSGMIWKLVAIIGGLVVLVAVGWLVSRQTQSNDIDTNTYQLVSLTTGERYVGKLSHLNDNYIVLSDVYFQQNTPAGSKDQSESVAVAPLSSAVAGTENTMHIARDKVVHWENLKSDSKVLRAIKSNPGS